MLLACAGLSQAAHDGQPFVTDRQQWQAAHGGDLTDNFMVWIVSMKKAGPFRADKTRDWRWNPRLTDSRVLRPLQRALESHDRRYRSHQ